MKFTTIVLSAVSIVSVVFGLYQKNRADKLADLILPQEHVDQNAILAAEHQRMEAIMQTEYASITKSETRNDFVIAAEMALKAAEITPN